MVWRVDTFEELEEVGMARAWSGREKRLEGKAGSDGLWNYLYVGS